MLQQARFATSLAMSNPRLLGDYARWYLNGRCQVAAPRQLHSDVLTIDQARVLVEAEFGGWTDGPALERVRAWPLENEARAGGGAHMAGDSMLGLLVYGIARGMRPDTIIETGVATGVTSAYLLAALEDNRHGILHSIDLPPTDMVAKGNVGAAIPDDLRDRWVYHWGASRRLLPALLKNSRGKFMFVHDSDHSYKNMAWEIRSAWQAMSSGGVIVCDDVELHDAFLDAAAELNGYSQVVGQAEKHGITGLLIRPATSDNA